jgi:hypothetical protein
MSNPRTTARTLEEIGSVSGLYEDDVLEKKYASRGSRETMAWISLVTAGLTDNQFSLLKSDAIDSDQLEAVYDLSMRVYEVQQFALNNGLASAFTIYKLDPSTGRPISNDTTNLLESYATTTLASVRASVKYTKEWEEDHVVWAMTLTLRLIENSCEADLRERINERLMGIPLSEIGGPTYFKVAMECITSMSHSVSRALSLKVQSLKIRDFEGENVLRVISFLRGALSRLRVVNMVPPDTEFILFEIFQSTTCQKFNLFFTTWYTQRETQKLTSISGSISDLDTEIIFRVAESQYRTMLEDGSWQVTAKRGSGFCGEATPKGGANNAEGQEGDGGARHIPKYRVPPGEGEPHQRMFKGAMEYWCGRCKRWNKHHLTDNHRTKAQLEAERSAAAALTAAGSPPPASTTTTSTTTPAISPVLQRERQEPEPSGTASLASMIQRQIL